MKQNRLLPFFCWLLGASALLAGCQSTPAVPCFPLPPSATQLSHHREYQGMEYTNVWVYDFHAGNAATTMLKEIQGNLCGGETERDCGCWTGSTDHRTYHFHGWGLSGEPVAGELAVSGTFLVYAKVLVWQEASW